MPTVIATITAPKTYDGHPWCTALRRTCSAASSVFDSWNASDRGAQPHSVGVYVSDVRHGSSTCLR